ncbi:germination protein, Ger(x)C family [Paenibacillus curdlanolyticus YK9]|uniref:Germination protein, Ger(X)C family n=1 Tax=Paenibacillus curdlanolyticus YK9 TaxID=717606 RepID=E0I8B1_9BACL|nr:Ger(x)C family spore germination protein [Paenibacillus curdlanolyticus]EFM11416.1 germination protein, Ger(x)C family [Paenibacillus curdlanolyticus YK9]
MKRKLLMGGLIVAMLFVSGCWNRREMNDLAIAVAYGIDKAGDGYRLTVQVVDPGEVASQKGSTDRTPVTTYQATGETIFEALRRMTKVSPRKIYNSHLRMLVISDKVAEDGIANVLDFVSRNHEHRGDFYVVIAKDTTASNTLKILTHLESIPANQMYSSLETSERSWAPTSAVTLDELIDDIVSPGKQPAVTGLRIKGSQTTGENKRNVNEIASSTQLVYNGLAVFKKDKLIGWLNEEESKAYNYIQDNVKSTVGVVYCPGGGNVALEVMHSATKVKGKVVHGKPTIDVSVRMRANIGEVRCSIDLSEESSLKQLEQNGNRKVQQFIEETIATVQKKYKVDIFGFGEVMHREQPKYWKTVQDDWDTQFQTLAYRVNVECEIRYLGTQSNSFLEEMDKKE